MMHCLSTLSLVLLALAAGVRLKAPPTSSARRFLAAFTSSASASSKMNKPEVMDVLTRVLAGYDINLVQEIAIRAETAIHNLTEYGCRPPPGCRIQRVLVAASAAAVRAVRLRDTARTGCP